MDVDSDAHALCDVMLVSVSLNQINLTCLISHLSLSNKKWEEPFKILWLTFFTSVPVMMPGFLTRSNRSNLQTICSQIANSAPHEPRCFLAWCSSVCNRIGQRHRAQQVNVTQVRLAQYDLHCICVQRPAPQVSPPFIARRLVRPRS